VCVCACVLRVRAFIDNQVARWSRRTHTAPQMQCAERALWPRPCDTLPLWLLSSSVRLAPVSSSLPYPSTPLPVSSLLPPASPLDVTAGCDSCQTRGIRQEIRSSLQGLGALCSSLSNDGKQLAGLDRHAVQGASCKGSRPACRAQQSRAAGSLQNAQEAPT